MAGTKSKPKAVELAKKMSKKRPNAAVAEEKEVVTAKDAKRRKGKLFC